MYSAYAYTGGSRKWSFWKVVFAELHLRNTTFRKVVFPESGVHSCAQADHRPECTGRIA